MGIQINGNTNNINAGIGSLSIEDLNELDIVGVATASNFKTGSSNLHSTGLTVGNALVHSTGVNVGTGATVHSPATNVITLGTNSSERLRITSAGKVGIGTNNALSRLHVADTNTTVWPFTSVVAGTYAYTPYPHELIIDNDVRGTEGSFAGIYFNAGADTDGSKVSTARIAAIDTGSYKADLVFSNRGAGGSSHKENLRITSAGQLVMGATTSKAKFEIKDNGYTSTSALQRISADNDDLYALIIANDTLNTDAISGLQFYVGNTGTHMIRARGSSTASNNNLNLVAQNDVIFNSGSSEIERLRIASTGVATFTNNSPPATGVSVLHVTNSGSSTTLGTAATLRVSNNGGNASYSVFEAESGSGSIRLANDGKFHVSGISIFSSNINVDINTGSDGIIGEAYTGYFGLKHADQTINSEYMIISNDVHTYISSSSGGGIYLRPNANNSSHETIFAINTTTFKTHIMFSSGHYLQRSDHHTGHLVGSYNNVGANSSKSNPIYTIGSNYNPGDNDLGNMYGIGYSHGNNASFISFSGLTGWGLYVASDGDCRMFLDGSTGKIAATGTISGGASDVRLKTNIKVIDNPIEKIKKIRGVTFDWIDNITTEYDFHPDSMHETGVIAQEIQEVIPDAVATAPFNGNYTKKSGTDNNFLTVKDEKIIPLCIEAIKELSAQVELLKSKVATLEGS